MGAVVRVRAAALAAVVAASAWRPVAADDSTLLFGMGAEGSKDLGDATCDMDTVQGANIFQLHPILHDLVNTTFFRLFRVSKVTSCPFWQKAAVAQEEEHVGGATCTGGGPGFGSPAFLAIGAAPEEPEVPCDIDSEETSQEPGLGDLELDRSMTMAEQIASITRDNESESECEFEEDLPSYWVDMISCDSTKGGELEDVNLIKNPERNTGYNGSHIWEAMYKENCFEVGSSLPRGRFGVTQESGMCYEERVLYRLLSGWHASTTISVVKSFYAPGTKLKSTWAPNLERFMKDIGQHPERVKNLHFSFVVMLRAVKKAAPFLQNYPYYTGISREDNLTKSLMNRLLESQVLSLCSPLFDAFDETRLFQEGASSQQRSQLKRQFKSVFQNITVLVDCVQCQRCRLHAKVFSLGLGTALKILLTPPHLMATSTSRDEVVALVHVLWKLSEAMEDARVLTQLYYQDHADTAKTSIQAAAPPTPADVGAISTATTTAARNLAGAGFAAGGGAELQQPHGQPKAPSIGAVSPVGLGSETRAGLLDAALGAVRSAASSGALSGTDELEVLRSLVVQPASDEVLLLARHYAATRPDIFATLAREAAAARPRFGAVAVPSPPLGPLGTSESPADAVVVGGGLAGMVATLTLLDRGARVVLVDKQPYLGGNSGKASSGINAALETSVESLVKDTTKSAGVLAREQLIEKLAMDSAPAVSWLKERTGVDLSMRAQLGGHTAKRTLRPSNAFVGAEITFVTGEILKKVATQSPGQFRLLTKTKLIGVAQGGAGWRATVVANGSEAVLEGVSLVLASGGFGHDAKEAESLLLKHRPDLAGFPTTLGAQTTGDGVKIARDLGAKLVDMDRVQLHPTGFVDPKKPAENTKTLAAELLRGVGGLLLDRNGRRFTDELGTRQAVVNAELKTTDAGQSLPAPNPPRTFAMVLNGKAAKMADRHSTLYSQKGLLVKVQGVAGLAEKLAVPVENLRGTFTEYNEAARAGSDKFGRKVFPEGHWPIEDDEEFYVGQIVPVIHYTMGGIAIDPEARVLRESDGSAFLGLYAIGEASGGVHGDNRLAGNSLLECTVFGRQVGLSLPIAPQSQPAQALDAQRFVQPASAPAAQPAAPAQEEVERKITMEELEQHKGMDKGNWVALYGKVYELSDYVAEHPGGEEAITDVAGMDGTEKFAAVHNKELLESMGFIPVGTLVS